MLRPLQMEQRAEDIWHRLHQERVFDHAEHIFQDKVAPLCIQRRSYINRVFELALASGQRRIVKYYRPGRWTADAIGEEHRFLASLAEMGLPVVAPLRIAGATLHERDGFFLAYFEKRGGRAVDDFDAEQWEQVGRLLGRMHLAAASFSVEHRVRWHPDRVTRQQLQMILERDVLPPDYKTAFVSCVEQVIQKAVPLFNGLSMQAIHGDCHLGNVIYRPGEGFSLIDFDDMAVGPVVQDVWMLLPGTPDDCEGELVHFLKGYETFQAFPRASLDLVPALKAMRIVHFIAWCAMQARDAGFREHFPDWGQAKYWTESMRELQGFLFRSEDAYTAN